MQFLLLLGGIAFVLIIFAIGPLMAVLHVFLRSDWQPIGGRNFIWALLVLIPLRLDPVFRAVFPALAAAKFSRRRVVMNVSG